MDCRLLRPWYCPGKSTEVGCHFLLQRILPIQGSKLGLPHCRQTLLLSEPPGSKESTANARDPGSNPGSGRSTGEGISYPLQYSWASLVAQLVKNLPAIQETWVRSLGWENPLERERLPMPVFWPREFHGLYSPWGHRVRHN